MKQLLLLLILLFAAFTNAQIVNIPDANFKAELIFNGVDTNADGEIQESEALEVSNLNLFGAYISDITGVQAFSNLLYLNCSNNQITNLDVSQNTNLVVLWCYNNAFASLDVTQNIYLESLDCTGNGLIILDVTQNANLETLNVGNNLLNTLDVTQNTSLEVLRCAGNQLISLDVSQNTNLEILQCGVNQLTNLDVTQNPNLLNLSCPVNLLETLSIKNGRIENSLNFSDNPNLLYICADEDQVASVQADAGPNVVVNSYCSFTLGGNYNTITGNVTLDVNSNGCDASDVIPPNIRVDINDGTNQGASVTNSSGNYSFYTESGNFIIAPNLENPTWFTVSPSTVTIPFTEVNNSSTIQDFCITPNGEYNDIEIIVSPINSAQPGYNATYQIVYKNKGNQIASGVIELTFNDSVLDYVSSSIGIASQSTGSLVWNYTNLNPIESGSITVVLNVNSPTETPAINIGDQLDFNVIINPMGNDESPFDNAFNLNQVVVGSYDPNDIKCLEGNIVSPEKIGEYLHYNIRFENTGTAAATFVVVKDLIDDTKFDMNSLQIMNSSYPMETRIAENKVEFIFDNINLGPDEKGNVVFKIKTLNTLSTGDSVSNKAEIYFDYNFPIETNIATTTFEALSVDEFGQDSSVTVYPNPTSGQLFVNSKYDIKSLALYDIQGRQVHYFNSLEENTLDITNVSRGVYFLEIETAKGKSTKKIIKD